MLEFAYIILKYWNIAWCISVFLIIFRDDSVIMFSEIFGMLVVPNILSVIVSGILIYILLPFTIPYSIVNIVKSK